MRALGFGLLILVICSSGPARTEDWRVEPPRRGTAASLLRVLSENTFFGFTCWRGDWGFFFHHEPRDGGTCDDKQECEIDLRAIDASARSDAGFERVLSFELFENTYYLTDALKREDMARIERSEWMTLLLDGKLRENLGIEALHLPLNGLKDALDKDKRRFACAR